MPITYKSVLLVKAIAQTNRRTLYSYSGGSRGFLLVLKNYPFSELKDFFIALWLLKQVEIALVDESSSKFHAYPEPYSWSPLHFTQLFD